MSSQKTNARYTQFHINLSYVLGNDAMVFIQHITDRDYLRDCGRNTKWSSEWFRETKMDISRTRFNKCVALLSGLGIITVEKRGLKSTPLFELDYPTYYKFLEVSSCSNDIKVLREFGKSFIESKRSIFDVTEREMQKLRDTFVVLKNNNNAKIDESEDSIAVSGNTEVSIVGNDNTKEFIAGNDNTIVKTGESIAGNDNTIVRFDNTNAEIEHLLSEIGKKDKQIELLINTVSQLSSILSSNKQSIAGNDNTKAHIVENDNTIVGNDNTNGQIQQHIYNNINNKKNIKNNSKSYNIGGGTESDEENGRDVLSEKEPNLVYEESGDSLESPILSKNKIFIDRVRIGMEEEYPEGDKPKRTELLKTFSELKEDHLSHDEELSQLTIEDIFPHFQIRAGGVRIQTYYSEHIDPTEEEILETFMAIPVYEIIKGAEGMTDIEKMEIIKEGFREDFPEGEKFELSKMKDYVVQYMRDYEVLRACRMMYNDPTIISFLFPEVIQDRETRLWLRKPQEESGDGFDIIGEGIYKIKPRLLTGDQNESGGVDEFKERLKDFDFPRKINTNEENGKVYGKGIISEALIHIGYKNGDYMTIQQRNDFLDALASKSRRHKLECKGTETWIGFNLYLDQYYNPRSSEKMIQVQNLKEKETSQ